MRFPISSFKSIFGQTDQNHIPPEMFDFLRRFDHFSDTVLESISVDYGGDHPFPHIQIVLNSQDGFAESPIWRRCFLDFRNVQEFKIAQNMNRSSSVISFGVAVTMVSGLTYVDFNCLGDKDRTIEQVRASGFFIGAEILEFGILDD